MTTHLILLAAGEGTRMQSDTPKVLHEIAGLPLFAHALSSGRDLDPGARIIVVGAGGDAVRDAVLAHDPDAQIVVQHEQRGTGHAVQTAAPALVGKGGNAIVLYGDTPFIRPETLSAMTDAQAQGADLVVLGFTADPTTRYGRLVTNSDALERIVEWKDATPEERGITLCNSGVILTQTEHLLNLLDGLTDNNEAGEYYLTDIVALARAKGLTARVVTCDEAETLGVNSRADLARAEAVFQEQARAAALAEGVTLQAPDSVYFGHDTVIGRDAYVEPHVVFGPGVTVESGARIRAFSHLEGCHVGKDAIVGPYARLRPGTELSNDVRVGNFVEIKNAVIADGAKVNHLSYVGDASVGESTNIGAGTITCNYDGVFKHKTTIGARAFIGSNTMLVAPVQVGDDAMTATGTVVTRDVPAGDMAIGRPKQDNKAGLARRLFAKLRAAKAAKQKD